MYIASLVIPYSHTTCILIMLIRISTHDAGPMLIADAQALY